MRYIEPPHIILRKTLINREMNTSFAADLGMFIAHTLFKSSGLALPGVVLRSAIAKWSRNTAMCALTEQVIFTDPYTNAAINRWTSPELDNYAMGIRNDTALKIAAAYHKELFMTKTQALLHADLHTGSVMVKQGSTLVIDPEFAFYGPIGFDVGAILSNLFLSAFAHFGTHGEDYAEFVLLQAVVLHNTFEFEFKKLWSESMNNQTNKGDLFHASIFSDFAMQAAAINNYMQSIWRDSLGFTGMKMIRRIVGIAHVADLETIADARVRANCEKRAIVFARQLVLASYDNTTSASGHPLGSIKDVVQHLSAFARSDSAFKGVYETM